MVVGSFFHESFPPSFGRASSMKRARPPKGAMRFGNKPPRPPSGVVQCRSALHGIEREPFKSPFSVDNILHAKQGNRVKEESSSFLKKRTKKLLLIGRAPAAGARE
jgi:hypothetical protein